MREKITINPAYTRYTDFITGLPESMESQGEVIQDRRNLIKVIQEQGILFNVKRYRKPIWINRVAYTFFRSPKARRAYHNSAAILDKGFSTPEPVALIEQYEGGLLSHSYFVSTQIEQVREIRDYYYSSGDGSDSALLKAFARYTAALHEAGIFHKDFSPGNILISGEGAQARFSLVDINRMSFGDVSLRKGCSGFARLFEYDPAAETVACEYAIAREADQQKCVKAVLRSKHSFERRSKFKVRIKRLIKKTAS